MVENKTHRIVIIIRYIHYCFESFPFLDTFSYFFISCVLVFGSCVSAAAIEGLQEQGWVMVKMNKLRTVGMDGKMEGRGSKLRPSSSSFSLFSLLLCLFSLFFSFFLFFVTRWLAGLCVLSHLLLSLLVSYSSSLSLLVGHAIKGPLPAKFLPGEPCCLDNLGEVRVLWVNVHRPQHGLRIMDGGK